MYEHETALQETGVNINDLPRSLKAKINRFKQMLTDLSKLAEEDPKKAKRQIELDAYSAVIADEIQDFYEKDLEEEETPSTPVPALVTKEIITEQQIVNNSPPEPVKQTKGFSPISYILGKK